VVELAAGDELLIVTDGITEAMDPARELFGEDRIADLVGRRDVSAAALLPQLLAQVKLFEAGSPQSDDIAAILLRLGTGQANG
jgi:sigma-B regulation protein RsbU (phosphoserine phosphatase)